DNEKVAAGHPLGCAEYVFTGEFAVHHRHPPVAFALKLLAELPAVAEEPKIAADLDALVLDDRKAVVAGSGRAGEDTLPDTADEGFLQRVTTESKKQEADARPAIGCFFFCECSLDPGFGVAADDGGSIASDHLTCGLRPSWGFSGDDQPSRRHRKRFGKGVFDRDGVDREQGHDISELLS